MTSRCPLTGRAPVVMIDPSTPRLTYSIAARAAHCGRRMARRGLDFTLARRGFARRVAAAILQTGLLLHPALTQAARSRPVNLAEMTQRADRIFSGRCVNVRVAHDSDLDQVVTYVTLTTGRIEKGPLRDSLTIKLLGDQDADSPRGRATEGIPVFRKGEEVILFLYGDSRHGLTSPVGFGQGMFRILRDKEGRPLALNQFANEGLLRGLSPDARRRLGRDADTFQGRQGIPPDSLLDLVRSLRPRSAGPF
jgi:hypothetical protein